METEQELLEHNLKDMYFAEQRLVKALAQLAKESKRPDVKMAYQDHMEQTKNHVKRLESAFDYMDMKPKKETCHAILGLIKEKQEFKKEKPSPEILEEFNLISAMKVEHYEISAYESMISLADVLGHDDVSEILSENLEEEKRALEDLKEFAA